MGNTKKTEAKEPKAEKPQKAKENVLDIEKALKGEANPPKENIPQPKEGEVVVEITNIPDEVINIKADDETNNLKKIEELNKIINEVEEKKENIDKLNNDDPQKAKETIEAEIKNMEKLRDSLKSSIEKSNNKYTSIWNGINYGL